MVRLSYRHELRSALTFPLAGSLAEGAFTGVIAAKNFDASAVLISLIAAAPMFGNIAAMVWSELSLGKKKVPFVNMLQLGVVVMIASVALVKFLPTHVAGWVFASQIVAARILYSGVITLRSGIWLANYPRAIRGQITSRIAVVATAVLTATTLIGSKLLDINPEAYVYIYPTAALLGVVGIWQFSKIRVRREGALRRMEAEQVYAPRPESMAETDEANVMNFQPRSRVSFDRFFGQAYRVLREDKQFRIYQRWQMVNGIAFMMTTPAILYMVSKEMTEPTEQYMLANLIVLNIPMLTVLLFTQAWAPLFDRVHVTVFRACHNAVGALGLLTIFAGAFYQGSDAMALGIVGVGQVFVGIAHAGGNIAWNLGHNAFAPADKAATYMGVHVMLTGVRGCVAPFVGAWLYQIPQVHRYVFGIGAIFAITAMLGFWSMARKAPKKAAQAVKVEELVGSSK
jgi:hypothetical protein